MMVMLVKIDWWCPVEVPSWISDEIDIDSGVPQGSGLFHFSWHGD